MSDRVELSEALRSILDDSGSEVEEKENKNKTDIKTLLQGTSSSGSTVRSCLKPLNKTFQTPPRHEPFSDSYKRLKVGFEEVQSPLKKRRHANHVIILRQPRKKAKQTASPKSSPTRNVASAHVPVSSDDGCLRTPPVKEMRQNTEFTVELETGSAGTPQHLQSQNAKFSSSQDVTPVDHSSQMAATFQNTPVRNNYKKALLDMMSPPSSRRYWTPISVEKALEAAIDTQIKPEPSEEELESCLPVLDGLDLTVSPFCHFADSSQRDLYTELSTLDNVSDTDCDDFPWLTDPVENPDLAVSQQLLQFVGKYHYKEGQPCLHGKGPMGRWSARGGNADDSLTNITWLKRMSAPDLDPDILQTAHMVGPHFERPPHSYSHLIQYAISSAPSGKMTLREIYTWIEEAFPYFKTAKAGWRNSIRHNLSLHKIFVREPPAGQGQPAYWTLLPGTVVRLPENKAFVADVESGGMLQEGSNSSPPVMFPPMMANQEHRPPFCVGGAMPQVVMLPKPKRGLAKSKKGKEKPDACSGSKTKKPPLILPRGVQPYALVPVPLLIPPNQNSGQTQSEGPTAVPHILSPVIMGGPRHFAAGYGPQMVGGRKVVPIAPKACVSNVNSQNPGVSKTGGCSSLGNTSSGSDSGVDVSGYGVNPNQSLTSGRSDCDSLAMSREMPVEEKGGQKSLPEIREESDQMGEDSFTEFFDRELASPPRSQTRTQSNDMPVMSTPHKAAELQIWMSPLRGFTPFKVPPPEEDSGVLYDLNDLSLTPLTRGLMPVAKRSTPGRSRLGSLGDLGLPGLTPEKGGHSSVDIHNQSFGQIFGDLGVMNPEGNRLDVGNASWSVFSPDKSESAL